MIIEITEVRENGDIDPLIHSGKDIISVIMPTTNLAQAILSARRMKDNAGMPMRMIIVQDNIKQGYIKTLNKTASMVSSDYIAYVAQDSLSGRNWLKIAFETLEQQQKSLCALNDGKFEGTLASFGLVKKAFCEQFYGEGNIFYPGYHSHRADDELTLHARLTEQLIYVPSAIMLEVDYRLHRPINNDDIALFEIRKKQIKNEYDKL
jgi:hypothetical protein